MILLAAKHSPIDKFNWNKLINLTKDCRVQNMDTIILIINPIGIEEDHR